MPILEGQRLREGDVVTINGVVRFDDEAVLDKHVFVHVGDPQRSVSVPRDQIIDVARPKFNPGETVLSSKEGCDGEGIVRGVDGDYVWANFGGNMITHLASELKLVIKKEGTDVGNE